MKIKFKIFSALLVVVLLALFTIPLRAEVGTGTFLSGGTLTNNTTRTTGFSDVKVEDQEYVDIQINAQGDQAGTGVITLTVARSKDGVTFETTPRKTFAVALTGNTALVQYTNFTSLGATHTLRLISAQNADATASATNVTIAVVKKRVSVK